MCYNTFLILISILQVHYLIIIIQALGLNLSITPLKLVIAFSKVFQDSRNSGLLDTFNITKWYSHIPISLGLIILITLEKKLFPFIALG